MSSYQKRQSFKSTNADRTIVQKRAKFQIRQRRCQPNLTLLLILAVRIIGACGYWRVRRLGF